MGAEASLTPVARPVAPGTVAQVELAVTNTGTVVDSFTFEVLGDPAPWALAEPAELSLFPGQGGTATLRFTPPVDPGLTPGPRPYAVRITSNEDPLHPRVEEGVLDIAGVPVLSADLSPRTGRARGKRAGKYRVAIDNRGNAPAVVEVSGWDTQDLVDVTVAPPRIEVAPGSAVFVTARTRARTRFWRGPSVLHRFTVAARPAEAGAAAGASAPDPLDASLLQEAAIPGWVGKAAGIAVLAAIAAAALWFAVLKPVVR
ncbi:MAG: hydrolase, partial [Actinocrinis sp.]